MILVYIQNFESCDAMLQSALSLSQSLEKPLFLLCSDAIGNETIRSGLKILSEKYQLNETDFQFETLPLQQVESWCEENEVSFLFLQSLENKRKHIQNILNACRGLRIPYVIFKNDYEQLEMSKVLVPINFLEEEIEKAQFASAFGRFCQSEIVLFQAKDYGSKAAHTVERMMDLFSKFSFSTQILKATKDSFKVDNEAVEKALKLSAGLIIITASREYGLDDLFFGPKELHLLKKTLVPLMLVNPRGDLYALCD